MSGDIQKIYDDCLEDWPMASDDVRNAYEKINIGLDECIEAVQQQAFSFGYEQGMKAVREEIGEKTA